MAKETFQRTKPHVNIGTIGHVDHSQSSGLKSSMIVDYAKDQPGSRSGLWPSPHKSTPQVTSKGGQRKAIMYPGARTVAGVRNVALGVAGAVVIPGGSIISSAISGAMGFSSTSSSGAGVMKQSLPRQNTFQGYLSRYNSRVNVVMSNILNAAKG